MGAFAGIYNKDCVVLATDTLSKYPYREDHTVVHPMGFSNKAHILPQFRSVFTTEGNQVVDWAFYKLANYSTSAGSDIRALIGIPVGQILDEILKDCGAAAPGRIVIYGWNDVTRAFEGYQMPVNAPGQESSWNRLKAYDEGGTCLSSPDPNAVYEVLEANDSLDLSEYVRELIVHQKSTDALQPVINRVGVGGEIIVTVLQAKGGRFHSEQWTEYRFPDYDSTATIIEYNAVQKQEERNSSEGLARITANRQLS